MEEWKTKPKNRTIGWGIKKIHLIIVCVCVYKIYIYISTLSLKRIKVKIKYPKLLEVYVNIEF